MTPYGLSEPGERFTAQIDELVERARTRELAGPELATALATTPDLSGIDLSGVDLDGADLEGAVLEGATLTSAGLGMSNLRGVNAFGADLSQATLTGSDLSGASLGCPTLTLARLREAHLVDADFRAADLRDAELSGCDVSGACFDEADLRGATLRSILGYRSAEGYGADVRDINFAGAYRLRRHVGGLRAPEPGDRPGSGRDAARALACRGAGARGRGRRGAAEERLDRPRRLLADVGPSGVPRASGRGFHRSRPRWASRRTSSTR